MEAFLKNFDLVPLDLRMILAGVVLFIILLHALKIFVFVPFLAVVEARERATIGAEEESKRKTDEAELLEKSYGAQIIEERQIGARTRGVVLGRAKDEATRVVQAAEDEARQYVKGLRQQLEKQILDLRKTSIQEAQNLSRYMTERIKDLSSGGVFKDDLQ